MTLKRARWCLVASLMFVVGCSSPEPENNASISSELDQSEAAPGELAFVDTVAPLLRLGLDGGARSLVSDYDPLDISLSDQSAVVVSDLLFDGLTEVDGRTGQLVPALATSWSANDDFTVWSFVLDSERVSVSEVLGSLERVAGSGTLASSVLGESVGVAAVESADESAVVVRLSRPNAGLPWVLSGLPYSIVGIDQAPTGRFVIASESEDLLVLESADGDVEVTWLGVDESGADLLADDSVDVAWVDVRTARGAGALEGADQVALGTSRFFVLNGASGELSDAVKREAVVAAVERANFSAVQGLADGLVAEVDGASSSGLAGYVAGACEWCSAGDERARDLLQVTPTVGPLVVGHSGGAQAEAAQIVVGELLAAGFDARAQAFTPGDFATGVATGSIDIFGFGWVAVAGSLDASVGPLFGSASSTNVFGVGWAEVDELLISAAGTSDDSARWALLRKAEAEALSQSIVIPIGSESNGLAGVSAAEGVVVRADGSIDLDPVG